MSQVTPHKTLQVILQGENTSLNTIMQKVQIITHLNTLWQNAIDENLINHSRVANLREDCLVIEVDSAAWLMRLRYRLPDLLTKLRQYPELNHLRTIDWYIQPAATNHKTIKKTANKLTFSVAASEILQETAESTEHPKLKMALQKLANTLNKDLKA